MTGLNRSSPFHQHLLDRNVVICCGTGGVGKTTISASLALKAALLGKRVLVMTIDPAKRLADSLGTGSLGNDEREVDLKTVMPMTASAKQGSLHALMVDTKRTFDDLIHRHAPDDTIRERILNNPVYTHLSNAMAGSQEFMALEKLYDILEKGTYDLIILDTPPSQHAVDFVDAPGKMVRLLNTDILRWLVKPYFSAGKLSLNLLEAGSSLGYQFIRRLAGTDLLRALSDFFRLFTDLYDGFRARSAKIQKVLVSSKTVFFLVASPEKVSLHEGSLLYSHLRNANMPFSTFIFNRVSFLSENPNGDACDMTEPPRASATHIHEIIAPGAEGTIPRGSLHELLSKLESEYRKNAEFARIEKTLLDEFLDTVAEKDDMYILKVPLMGRDVTNLGDLYRLSFHLA
jgi:anion-transporting  ArsA/GET3 family ATPase